MRPALSLITFLLIITLFSCQNKKTSDDEAGKPIEAGGTEILEKEVMEIHDEVMPRMGELYNWKSKLKDKMDSAGVTEDQKKELVITINKIDSAYNGMMDWMHKYNPVPDSISEERAREYLENEMERIKKVKEDILSAIEKAEAVSKQP